MVDVVGSVGRVVVGCVAAAADGEGQPAHELVEDRAEERAAGDENDDAGFGVGPGDDTGDSVGEVVEVDGLDGEETQNGEDDRAVRGY